jgi:hypothetical protein
VEGSLCPVPTLAVDGGEWSVLHPARVIPVKRAFYGLPIGQALGGSHRRGS